MQHFNDILSSLTDLSLDEKLALREAIDEQLHGGGAVPAIGAEVSPQVWAEEFRRWAAAHRRLPYEADDSRESIYEGRGE